jgi:S1-C subfamily serine protease
MRLLRNCAMFGAVLTTLVPHLASQADVAGVVERTSDAVVLITISKSAGQGTALGSGFLISPDGEIVNSGGRYAAANITQF